MKRGSRCRSTTPARPRAPARHTRALAGTRKQHLEFRALSPPPIFAAVPCWPRAEPRALGIRSRAPPPDELELTDGSPGRGSCKAGARTSVALRLTATPTACRSGGRWSKAAGAGARYFRTSRASPGAGSVLATSGFGEPAGPLDLRTVARVRPQSHDTRTCRFVANLGQHARPVDDRAWSSRASVNPRVAREGPGALHGSPLPRPARPGRRTGSQCGRWRVAGTDTTRITTAIPAPPARSNRSSDLASRCLGATVRSDDDGSILRLGPLAHEAVWLALEAFLGRPLAETDDP